MHVACITIVHPRPTTHARSSFPRSCLLLVQVSNSSAKPAGLVITPERLLVSGGDELFGKVHSQDEVPAFLTSRKYQDVRVQYNVPSFPYCREYI